MTFITACNVQLEVLSQINESSAAQTGTLSQQEQLNLCFGRTVGIPALCFCAAACLCSNKTEQMHLNNDMQINHGGFVTIRKQKPCLAMYLGLGDMVPPCLTPGKKRGAPLEGNISVALPEQAVARSFKGEL